MLHLFNSESNGMVVAPTIEGIFKYCVPALEKACQEIGLQCHTYAHGHRKRKFKHMLIEGRVVALYTAEDPASITGDEYGHAWCDEYARYPFSLTDPLRNADLQIRSRLRCPRAHSLHGLVTTTPEGTETALEINFANPRTRKPGHRLYVLPTIGNTALQPEYIAMLKGSMAPELIEQYLNGRAVTYLANRAHKTFLESEHVREVAFDARLPLHLGCDYNVSPMAWLVAQIIPGDTGEVRVLDELIMEDFGQVDSAMAMANAKGWGDFFVRMHPDKSAKARSTVGDPEFEVMRRSAKGFGWRFDGSAHGANPPVDARINLVSRLCCDGTGRKRLVVDPRCTWFIDDMLKTARSASGHYDPGPQGKRGHILDAFGYLVWDECRPGREITTTTF